MFSESTALASFASDIGPETAGREFPALFDGMAAHAELVSRLRSLPFPLFSDTSERQEAAVAALHSVAAALASTALALDVEAQKAVWDVAASLWCASQMRRARIRALKLQTGTPA